MNNVYVRSNKTVSNIILMRVLVLIPLIIYGFYKNGLYLYIHKYVNIFGLLKPIIILVGSLFINLIVDFITCKIKKHKFEITRNFEYVILISSLISINTNLIVYVLTLTIILIISKFLDDKVNIVCLMLIIMYLLTNNFTYNNLYESSKTFELNMFDLLMGNVPGGIFSTHIVLILIALVALHIMDNNKTTITISSLITFFICCIIVSILKHYNYLDIILSNNNIYLLSFVSTIYIVSPYTKKGKLIYGILIGFLAALLNFFSPILAPLISILIMSLFVKIIDKKCEKR